VATGFPSLLQAFFTDRLLRQQRASPNTVAGYRDSFRLLFHFAKERLSKAPSNLAIEDLNVSFIGDFLDHLENRRKNSARTRNIRLAAIHSFFQYVAFEEPAHALHCQRILAMPTKRHERRPIEFLNREEIDALLGGSQPFHLDRAPRPDVAGAHRADWPSGLRVDRPDLPGYCLGNGCACPLSGKGQKTSMHASSSRNGKNAGSLDAGTP